MARCNEEGPDVNLSGALVEEEHVLDEHEPASLRDGAEEAVEDARRHERFETAGRGTPRCRCGGDDEEPEHDGEATEVGG